VRAWDDRVAGRADGALELNVDDDLRAYSADVISRTCFGSNYVKGKEVFAMIRELQQTVTKPNLLAEMTGLRFLPTRSSRAAWRLNRRVRTLILDLVKESAGGGREDDGPNLLTALLRSAKADAGSVAAAEDFVVDNCKNIYFAGYETTAVTAAWCLMLLALHPDWQRRVRDEAREALGGGAAPDFLSLQKMKQVRVTFVHDVTRRDGVWTSAELF
jgi:cytochrome P450